MLSLSIFCLYERENKLLLTRCHVHGVEQEEEEKKCVELISM